MTDELKINKPARPTSESVVLRQVQRQLGRLTSSRARKRILAYLMDLENDGGLNGVTETSNGEAK